jgi:hypothetical protein
VPLIPVTYVRTFTGSYAPFDARISRKVESPAWGIERLYRDVNITTTVSLGSAMSTGFQSPSNAAKGTFHRASVACKACHASKVPSRQTERVHSSYRKYELPDKPEPSKRCRRAGIESQLLTSRRGRKPGSRIRRKTPTHENRQPPAEPAFPPEPVELTGTSGEPVDPVTIDVQDTFPAFNGNAQDQGS